MDNSETQATFDTQDDATKTPTKTPKKTQHKQISKRVTRTPPLPKSGLSTGDGEEYVLAVCLFLQSK
jgi:hypothetical protein